MSQSESRFEQIAMKAAFQVMRLLPTEWASNLGGAAIRWSAPRNRPAIAANARKNLRFHKPGASEAELDRMVGEFFDGVGRVMAEFAVMHRLLPEGRITTEGFEEFMARVGTRPILIIGVHTGNWEISVPVFHQAGLGISSIIQPPDTAFEREVVERVRSGFGIRTILPDRAGTKQVIRVLKANGVVSMFPDEARNGRVMGPLFGRPPHEKGNLAIAVKLARMTGAGLFLAHCRRIGNCRFLLHFSEMFEMPERAAPDVLADVAFLNAKIEPVVVENIPRWYFLDDSISPLDA